MRKESIAGDEPISQGAKSKRFVLITSKAFVKDRPTLVKITTTFGGEILIVRRDSTANENGVVETPREIASGHFRFFSGDR